MKKNNYSNSDEQKEQSIKYILNKHDHDFYNEEDNKIEKILVVKRVGKNEKEKWKIMEDKKILLTIDSEKLTKKEKSFLRTIDGFKFLLEEYKKGIKSLNALKSSIKNKISIED